MIDAALDALRSLFAWPWLLLAIPLPWLVRMSMPARANPQPALRVPWGERLRKVASGRVLEVTSRGFPWLAMLAWCLLCVAAARPQQLGPAVAPPQVGRDMMLAVDLSASMGEEDMELGGRLVDRLTAAKAVLADFLDRRVGDRIGLVVFGDRAFALTPLTLDRDSVRQQLDASVVGLAGRATALGDAIALSTKRLQQQRTEQRVLIVLTDGVNTAGVLEPAKAAQIAREKAEAEENAKKLGAIQVKIAAKAGSNGKLFGSVTSKEISDALHEQFDLTIEKQKIVQAEPIKSFGAYEVKCKLGYEVTGTIHVLVIEEK